MTTERFEVDDIADVYGPDGTTVIGRIRRGTLYEGERRDHRWLMMRSPDGSPGYVKSADVQLVDTGDQTDRVEGSAEPDEATPENESAPDQPTIVAAAPTQPSSPATPSDERPTATPQAPGGRPRHRRGVLIGLSAAVLVGIAVVAVVALSGSGDDDSATFTVVPDPEPAPDSATSIPEEWPPDGEYSGQFEPEYFDDLGEGVVATVNELRLTVSEGSVTELSGGWSADSVPIDSDGADVLCRGFVILTHSIEAPASVVDGIASFPATVSILQGPDEAEPTAPDDQDCGLPGDTETVRPAEVTFEGQGAVVRFTNDDGEPRGRVVMSRSDP